MLFQLEALGGLRLLSADGQVVQAQRRRLALLALLAAAGDRGLTRDQLVGCLWPETTQDNAKHGLNQLVYGIRRTLSEGAIQAGDSLRLDPAVVDSDVRRFEQALAAGEDRHAIRHYGGPFLNGFYLADAPEFERWVERERARLASAHADALERLAADAERLGDAQAAVSWRRALVELNPLDPRRATALMRALATAGDVLGALTHGRTYEALVRHELEVPADPAVAALAREIRARSERDAATAAASASPDRMTASHAAHHADGPPDDTGSPRRAAGGGEAIDVVAPPTVDARSRRRSRVLIYGLAALVVAAASLATRPWTRERGGGEAAAATPGPSIAVLPLRNLSADPADAALADGMTEELIATLSRVDGLRVSASTSVYALAERGIDLRQIAESLHVSHVLEGTLQKDGRRLRLHLMLVDARDGATRWSDRYDREQGDVFAVQDDIAWAVTHELDARLARDGRASPRARRYTPRLAAYEPYLRGIDPNLERTAGGGQRAREHLARAIAADPNFASAHAALARAYGVGAGDGFGGYDASRVRAEQAALAAIALDDSLPEAHVALGWARIWRRDWGRAEAAFQHAIALDVNAPRAHEGLARLYLFSGRPAEQLKAARIGVELDPFSVQAVREFALALAMNGRCEEAIERLRPLKALNPPNGVAGVVGGQCFAAMERWPEAIAEFRWANEASGARTALAFLAYAQARGGEREAATAILSDLLAGRQNSHGAFGIATVYAGLGDYDAAFLWLDRAVDEGSVRPYLMGPMFDELRRDPRFTRVKRRLNL